MLQNWRRLRMSNQVKSFKNALSDCMMAAAEKDPSIVLLSADSGPNSGFGPFIEKYPDRFYEMGIMEDVYKRQA